MDFREFLLARPYFAIFQTASLQVGLDQPPLARPEDLIDRLPSLIDYLGAFDLVGTTEAAAAFFDQACAALALADPPAFPHHRKSRISAQQRQQMRAQYEELAHASAVSPFIRAERELYRLARTMDGLGGSEIDGR
jgi:hypothetical protein